MLLLHQAALALTIISLGAFTSAQTRTLTNKVAGAVRPSSSRSAPSPHAPTKPTSKKPTTKKPTSKKPATKKPASKKPATLSGAAATTSSSTCKTKVVRKEIRDLSSAERKLFFTTLKKATVGRPSILNRLAATHLKNNDFIHAGPNFLPWHRLFIRRLEGELQKTEPKFALHYWDWTKDARRPERSAILSSSYYGGNSNGACLKTSTFGQIYAAVPSRHCLTRQYAQGSTPGPLYPRAITDAIRDQYTTFEDFAMALEGGPHAAPHNCLGGDIGTMQSPEDPLFYAHHSFVDYLYAQWQDLDRTRRFKAYSGVNQDGSTARTSDTLVAINGRVSDVLDYRKLCYSYAATGDPDDYGTENDMDWAGSSQQGSQQDFQQQQQQQPQASNGWVWDDNTQNWMWQGLVRRNYAATRAPSHDAAYKVPAAVAAPRANYSAPAVNDYSGTKPKIAPLRMLTDEQIECAAKQYKAPLVHPRPIDEDWLKMNGLCVVTQRALEQSYCNVIDKINVKIQENLDKCEAY